MTFAKKANMAQITDVENNPFVFFDPESFRPISIDRVQKSTTPVHRSEIDSGPYLRAKTSAVSEL